MPEFGQYAGFDQSLAPPPPPPLVAAALFELRPLSLGEILDRTFTLYRRNFWLCAGISAATAAVATISSFAQLTWGIAGKMGGLGARVDPNIFAKNTVATLAITLVTTVIYLVAYSITQAATVSAVSAVYLGSTTTIGDCFKAVAGKWYRYIGIALWIGFSAMWLPFLLMIAAGATLAMRQTVLGATLFILAGLSVVYAVIAAIRNSLGVVACVSEGLTVRASMKRSKFLVSGHKGRVLGIGLLVYVFNIVAATPQGLINFFVLTTHGPLHFLLEVIMLTIVFLTAAVVPPVSAIAFCIFYMDERVRKEGYDIEVLMGRSGGVGMAPPPFSQMLPGESPFSSELT